MSSYVVSKKEFVKAAGLMHGIEETRKGDAHKWFLDHVRDNFEKCYYLNVISVNEQYDADDTPETEQYDDIFVEYCRKGRDIWMEFDTRKMNRESLRVGLMEFFQSVLYQVENKDAAAEVSAVFMDCISKLYRTELNSFGSEWWTKIEV